MLVDTHTHIEGERFDEDREELIKRAKDTGLKYIVNSSFNTESMIKARDLSSKYDMVYFTAGFHPSDSSDYDKEKEEILIEIAKDKKCLAIGEIGLDYHYSLYDKDTQIKVFERQIEIAKSLNLPIQIHSREAAKDTFDILKRNNAYDVNVILHCYSGSYEQAKEYQKLGAYFGLGGVLTYKNSKKMIEVAKNIDINNLLLETDAPYLSPSKHRGKRNEPSYVMLVAEKLAKIREISVDEVISITYQNAKNAFTKLGNI